MTNIARAYVRRDAARRLLAERPPDFVKLFAAPLYEDDVEVIVTLPAPGRHRRLTPYEELPQIARIAKAIVPPAGGPDRGP